MRLEKIRTGKKDVSWQIISSKVGFDVQKFLVGQEKMEVERYRAGGADLGLIKCTLINGTKLVGPLKWKRDINFFFDMNGASHKSLRKISAH